MITNTKSKMSSSHLIFQNQNHYEHMLQVKNMLQGVQDAAMDKCLPKFNQEKDMK